MTRRRFVVGSDGGLSVELDALLASVEAEIGRSLEATERAEVEAHLDGVLSTSMVTPAGSLGLSRRVGDGRYLAVGDLGWLGLSIVLGPITHLLAAGSALGAARRLIAFDRNWRPRLVAIYARLEGGERDVFEAIHEAQNRWIVVNYDAVAENDFAAAYGKEAPSAEMVIEALQGERSAPEVAAALRGLLARRILASDGTRFWIRF